VVRDFCRFIGQVDTFKASLNLEGVESNLVRTKGRLSPDKTISNSTTAIIIFSDNFVIFTKLKTKDRIELGCWILQEACRSLHFLQASIIPSFNPAMNVSLIQVQRNNFKIQSSTFTQKKQSSD
jgi:hypothetical protein